MTTLNLEQFKIEQGQYWALNIRVGALSEMSLVGQNQNTVSPYVYSIGTGDAISHLRYEVPRPRFTIPVRCDPFLVERTTEAMTLRQMLARLNVVAEYDDLDYDNAGPDHYIITGEDDDVEIIEQLLRQVMSEHLLDRYSIEYDDNAITQAANAPYILAPFFDDGWSVLYDNTTTTAMTIMRDGQISYTSGFGRVYSGQRFENVSMDVLPEPARVALRAWLNETEILLVNGAPVAVLRPGVVDFLNGGGELHNDDERMAALKFFGLFRLNLIPDDLITQAQAAEIANVTPQAINNAIRANRLQSYSSPDAISHRPGDRRVSESEVRRLWQ